MTANVIPACSTIHGIRLVNLSLDESVAAIEAALLCKTPTKISFVNADCVNIASTNPAYRNTLAQSDWVFIDGVGMRIAGNLLGQPVRDNVNGTDLFPRLCQSMAQHGQRLFLLGARPGVAEGVAQWASDRFPALQIVGTQDGYYPPHQEAQVLENIRHSGADLLLVAMGAPRQEAWIAQHMSQTGVTIAMGVGGLFDFYSGRIPRAPLWMRNWGLEWLYRLLQEPGRLWRRYLVGNGFFLLRIGMDWIQSRLFALHHPMHK